MLILAIQERRSDFDWKILIEFLITGHNAVTTRYSHEFRHEPKDTGLGAGIEEVSNVLEIFRIDWVSK